jgi:hypothetical protein
VCGQGPPLCGWLCQIRAKAHHPRCATSGDG